jgi:hypothetical protein
MICSIDRAMTASDHSLATGGIRQNCSLNHCLFDALSDR